MPDAWKKVAKNHHKCLATPSEILYANYDKCRHSPKGPYMSICIVVSEK